MIMVIGPHRRKSDAKAERSAQHGERAPARQRTARPAAAAGSAAEAEPTEADTGQPPAPDEPEAGS